LKPGKNPQLLGRVTPTTRHGIAAELTFKRCTLTIYGSSGHQGRSGSAGHLQVIGIGARRLRRFTVAPGQLSLNSKLVGSVTLKRPEGRAPKNRQLLDASVEVVIRSLSLTRLVVSQ
jgi:hypothetical protein